MLDLSAFDRVEKNLQTLGIDEIVKLLGPLKIGMMMEAPIFEPGNFLYRGRKLTTDCAKDGIKLADLKHPPQESVPLGRVNRERKPMFYCAASKEVVFFEIPNLISGDEIILTFWQTTSKMLVSNIGYTNFMFEKLGAKRACPVWSTPKFPPPKLDQQAIQNFQPDAHEAITLNQSTFTHDSIAKILATDKNSALRQAMSAAFLRVVNEAEAYQYKFTTAIAELHLGEIIHSELQFAGLMYPTVKMSANGDNLALLPSFVDKAVEFKKALHARIDNRIGDTFSISYLDSATKIAENGTIKWLGRLPNWQVSPGQTVIARANEGRDKHGDYSISADGLPYHWVISDAASGAVIESS